MSTRVNEIKLDLDDLNALLQHATRQKSKDILGLEIRRLQTELINIQNEMDIDELKILSKPASSASSKCYDIKLNNYAWDQTDDFVKLYVTLNKVQTLPKEAVSCNFTEQSIDLHIIGLENKNYILLINNLCEDVDPSKSYIKVKTDMIIVYLAKKSKETWSCITSVEKLLKKSKVPIPNDDEKDPCASITSLMENMYEVGDDEMKQIIAKAWTDTLEKKQSGLLQMPRL